MHIVFWNRVSHINSNAVVNMCNLNLKQQVYRHSLRCAVYLAPTSFLRPSVLMDLGRSRGRPKARDQIKEDMHPRARETPNNTV